MKRLFFQSQMYDYPSEQEAKEHIRQMQSRGWHTNTDEQGESVILYNDGTVYPYSVEFIKYGR